MIRYITLLFVFIILPFAGFAQNMGKVVKILAIGNSFSEDAVEQNLREICTSEGHGVIIANLFIPACTLDMHYSNLKNNSPAYSYRKINVDGKKVTTENVSLSKALKDEEWDYISFQQASKDSGIFSTMASLGDFINKVREIVGKHSIFMWHSTWSYSPSSTHSGFKAYGNNELQMYHDIISTTRKVMEEFPQLKILIPTGTAIQDARTALIIGQDITRDGYHLEKTVGRYIAACTWYLSIFKLPFTDKIFYPKTITPENARLARQAATLAVEHPYTITPLPPLPSPIKSVTKK